MQTAVPLACFLSLIRPPGIQYENSLLQIVPVNKFKCPYVKNTNDVGFQLFTRYNPTVYQELVIDDDEKLFASNIDFNDKTMLYFHGWMEQPEDGSAIMVREAYMQRGDTNVIMVDAHHLEAGPWYFTAAQNTWYIGKFAALFIDYLVSRGLNLNNTHLIGHSLGAHIAGVASSSLKSGRVARLTALDPALPLFEHLPLEQRLDPSDAHFIDVIHSDAGIFGYKYPIGHVDFYPNGGISPQPGCELEVVIPQQQLLNKCDGRTQTHGFYVYYLSDKKSSLLKKNLENNLPNLFTDMHSIVSTQENTKLNENYKEAKHNKTNTDFIVKQNNTTHFNTENEQLNQTYEKVINIDNTTNFKTNTTNYKLLQDNENNGEKELININIKYNFKDKSDIELGDQIAEASEFIETRADYNQEILKENETLSLLNESREFVVENSTSISEYNVNNQTSKNNTEPVNNDINIKDDFNRLNLYNEFTDKSSTYKKERNIIVKELNYKDPCEETTEKIESTTGNDFNQQVSNEVKIKDRAKPKLNILQLLDTTYRIGRIIKAFHQNKGAIFNKFKIGPFKTTTPKTILNQIKSKIAPKNKILKRHKRFLSFFKNTENNDNMLVKVLEFLVKNRKNVVPVFMVMREINTLVKSSNGELNHSTKEQNSYIGGATPPAFEPITYTLELGNDNRIVAFIRRLVGMTPKGDRLTIGSGK